MIKTRSTRTRSPKARTRKGAASAPYWNPKNETMSREERTRLQILKLRRQLEWAAEHSPFHRERLRRARVTPASIRTLDDVRRIPFLTREEWMASQARRPHFGDLLAADPAAAIRYHLTSGTTGRRPLRVLDGMKDWEWIAEMWCIGFWGFGVRPADTVFFAFSYGSFIGFWGAHYACEKIGALVIPSGNMTTENRVRQIVEMGATTVCATPTYVLRLAQEAVRLGIDLPKESAVKRVIVSGEPAGSIPATRRMIESAWGAPVGDTAGMTEIGTIMIFECDRRPGGTHILEDHFIEEVLDPASGEPAAYGQPGERVVTSFGRGILPLLRYRTSDMVVRVPHTRCRCGRTYDIYEGGILGRYDDMHKIRGTNVYPRAVEAIVREYAAIDEFRILLTREGPRDEITLQAELHPGREAEWESLKQTLGDDLARNHEGLRFQVQRVDTGTLPRFELKAKRLVDQRSGA